MNPSRSFTVGFISSMLYSSSSILFSISQITADSKGFEQNLQCHRESAIDFFNLGEEEGKTLPISGVSGSINPSLQWQHFKAETLVPNSVTSQQRGHLQIKT